MNEFLADLYGTAENIGASDVEQEKLAQAQILDEMFESEGIDVDTLAPDTIEKVAYSLFGDENMIKVAEEDEEEDEEEGEKKAKEKVAEADFLGRVMAHSYVSEMSELEKAAGVKERGAELAGKAWSGIKGAPGAVGRYHKRGAGMTAGAFRKSPADNPATKMERAALLGKGLSHFAPHAGAAGLATYGGVKAMKKKDKKKESALDVLAEQRAMEMLNEAGYQGDGEEKLAGAVEQRALEILAENGYIE